MYTGTYKIAGQVIEICSLHPEVQTLCEDYRRDGAPNIRISITPEDIQRERIIGAQEEPDFSFPDSYLETLAVYRQLSNRMLNCNTLLFHGSAVSVDGQGYLFTAKSGTGKSTHTRLWRELLGDRAVMVNDDKPLLRIGERSVEVCGTPWNGKHHLGNNIIVPLRAICLLERGEVNEIHPITVREALPALMQQSYRPDTPGAMPQYLSLLDLLAKNVKFYRLRCNMDPSAAQVSFEAMSRAVNPD